MQTSRQRGLLRNKDIIGPFLDDLTSSLSETKQAFLKKQEKRRVKKMKKPDLFLTVMTSGRPKKVQLCDYFVVDPLGVSFA